MPKEIRTVQDVWKSSIKRLIENDEFVASGSYGQQQEIDLTPPDHSAGQIVKIVAFASGTPARGSAGYIYIFDSDPLIGDGLSTLTVAASEAILAVIEVETGDWVKDHSTAVAANLMCCGPVEFDPREALYVAWRHNDATSLNEQSDDEDTISVTGWAHISQQINI